MARVYLADKDTLDTVNSKVGTAGDAASATPGSLFAGIKQLISALSSHIASWTSARAGKIDKLDLVQATLNTPNGDTLAAWIKSISDNAGAANSNAANAANLASQANSNAWNAYQEAVNAKNAAGGSYTSYAVGNFRDEIYQTTKSYNVPVFISARPVGSYNNHMSIDNRELSVDSNFILIKPGIALTGSGSQGILVFDAVKQ